MHSIRDVRTVNAPVGGQCWRGDKKVLGGLTPPEGGVDTSLQSTKMRRSGLDDGSMMYTIVLAMA